MFFVRQGEIDWKVPHFDVDDDDDALSSSSGGSNVMGQRDSLVF